MLIHPRELREKIQPEILELIKQQRLNRLCEGSSFRKIGNRRRQGDLRAWSLGCGLGLFVPPAPELLSCGVPGGAGRERVFSWPHVCPGLS